MGYKNIAIFELMLLSVVLGRACAAIDTQEQVAANENQQSLSNLGSLSSSVSSSKLLSDSSVPGKSGSHYVVRFARAPNSMVRFSRSPSSQIRFGRSQPFVRFGRSNELNDDYGSRSNNHYTAASDKFIRFGKNGADEYYDDNIQIEPRSDSGFIRFGRSQNFVPSSMKADTLRAINWRNFLRLGRNTNANIRFAGKRDGSSSSTTTITANHHAIPIEMLLEKIVQQKQSHSSSIDTPDDRNMVNDDEQPLDGIDANTDQYQTVYSNGNDLEQN